MGGLYLASAERAFLENMAPSRARSGSARTLPRTDVERRLEAEIRARGESYANGFTRELLELVPWVHLTFAITLILFAAMTYRARTWAAIAGTLFSALALLASGTWQLYAMAHGIFSLLGLLSVPVAFGATFLGAFAVGDAHRATAVRRRLADEGIELGL